MTKKPTYSEYRAAIQEFFDQTRGADNAQRIRRERDEWHDRNEVGEERRNDWNDTNMTRRFLQTSTHRIRIYVSMDEPSLGIFAEGAKQRIRQAYLSGFRAWTHEYTIDMVNVRMRLLGRLGFITITPVDQFEFEFASSANPIQTDTVVGADGNTFTMYQGVHVRVHVEAVDGQLAFLSNIAKHKRTLIGGSDTSIIQRYYQVNLFDEPVSYIDPVDRFDRLRYNKTIMESWAPKSPHTGVHLRGVTLGMNVGITPDKQPMSPHTIRDIDVDIPFQKNENLNAVTNAFLRIDADWPRANGIQKVTSDIIGITRDFAIYVDAFNQFFVFPVEAIQPIDSNNPYAQNVDNAYVRQLSPTIPAWCFQQTAKVNSLGTDVLNGHWQIDAPEPDWKFDHLGKRAASIFYERVPYTYDSALFTGPDSVGAVDPLTSAEFDAAAAQLGIQSRQQATYVSGYHEQRYGIAPGIIEVVITIALTGEDLNMYTASIEVREIRRPTTSEYCPMFVGYVWYDVPFGAKVVRNADGVIIRDDRIAKAGDFVTLDIERYINTAGAGTQLFSVKRIDENMNPFFSTTETEILPLTAGVIHAIDLTSLSIMLGLSYIVDETGRSFPAKVGEPSYPNRRNDIQWRTQHFGVWAIIGAKHAEFMWPKLVPQTIRDQAMYLKDTVTKTYWRDAMNVFLNADPTYYRLTLNDPRDWSYGNYGAYRKYWLEHVAQHLGPSPAHPFPPDGVEIGNFIFNGLRVWMNASHLMYTATPKLAWYAYADAICTYYIGGANTTFYVHPNGTWAFFCNHLVYFPMGMPNNNLGAFVEVVSTYDIVDNVTVEHIIYDRVHLEMRTKKGIIARKNTSFQELYNIAVRKGIRDNSLDANIFPIEDKDLRATFEKNIYTTVGGSTPGITWLDLKATWDGTSYWMPETGIQGGQYYNLSAPIPAQQKILGLSFGDAWWTGAGYTGNLVYPETFNYHIRFSNPIVLQTVG